MKSEPSNVDNSLIETIIALIKQLSKSINQ